MKFIAFICCCFFTSFALGQSNDSIKDYLLDDFEVRADDSSYLSQLHKTRYYVRRVYSYAEIAVAMLNGYQDSLANIEGKRARKKYLKNANKELKEEFGEEIRQMSVNRGIYLMKLIYRGTGLSTYNIIKDYRGGGKAVFWQGLCLINGQNLKGEYDPDGEDAIVEEVIGEIESGELEIIPREMRTLIAKKAMEKEKKKKARKDRKRNKKVKKDQALQP